MTLHYLYKITVNRKSYIGTETAQCLTKQCARISSHRDGPTL